MGSIKIGNSDMTLKLGSSAVTAAYIGSTLVYSGSTPPTPTLQWVTFTNEIPSEDLPIYGIKWDCMDVNNSDENIYILDSTKTKEATIERYRSNYNQFMTWDGCEDNTFIGESELNLENGYTDYCGNDTYPPYYIDNSANQALESITYQLLIYQ